MKYVETIQILDGSIKRLSLHQDRCNLTRREQLGVSEDIDLASHIVIPEHMFQGLVKCRIVYGVGVTEVSYQYYQSKEICSLKIVKDDTIRYAHKEVPRPSLDVLYALRESHDEIIIIKNELVTDAYYYNLAFRIGDQWVTPKSPLLQGVMRQSLLNQGKLIEKDIHESEIPDYDQIALFNALNEFGDVLLDVEEVYF